MNLIFGSVAQRHVLHLERTDLPGGFLLASNHISHFDPCIISSIVRRKIDWMAMAEFFPKPVLGHFLRAVDAFPADRDRADRATIRTAIERLRAGRVVGIFPEGGIRDGANSVLEGAPLRGGIAALADLARVPIVPAVILGSDRFYSRRRWKPVRATPVWIAFGEPILPPDDSDKLVRRKQIETQFTDALMSLAAELRATFHLTSDDLPQPPKQRMAEAASTC
jgi:1-acyl-sn-glycerol-3-phosphate acyltransferase